jgi:hypothetical protein
MNACGIDSCELVAFELSFLQLFAQLFLRQLHHGSTRFMLVAGCAFAVILSFYDQCMHLVFDVSNGGIY